MAEAVVTFDYEATQDDELTLKEGQIITNINMMEDGWWEGELNGQRGLFPDNFVELHKKTEKPGPPRGKAPSPPPHEAVNGDSQEVLRRDGSEKRKQIRAKVVFSYSPQNEDEIGLQVDEVINVTSQPEDGWWEGVLRGKKGMFPSNFVAVMERNEAGDSEDAVDGAEVKATERPDEPPAEVAKPKPPKVKGVGFGNIFAGGEVKLRKTGGNSASDHSKKESTSAKSSELAQKRLSLKRAVPIPTAHSANSVETKTKAEPRKDIKPEINREDKKDVKREDKKEVEEEYEEIIKVRAKVIFPYEAQHSDELELKEGEIVTIIDKEAADSGWWLGEVDGRKGVFPDNFVTMLPPEKEKVKKKAPMPARPTSVVPRPPPAEIKTASSKPSLDSQAPPKPSQPPPSQPPPSSSQETSSTQSKEETPRRPSHPTTQPKDETNRKPHPQAAPKPPKKALPIPPKKPAVKSKPPPPKPSGPPPSTEREDTQPAVVLRRRPPPIDAKEGEVGFDDLKADSPQKLTHITLSRPKNANRRPPSVFGGQGGNLSDAPPVENGTVAPPPRPKSSPIGPLTGTGTVTAQSPSVSVTTSKGQTDSSAITNRPSSLISDTSNASNAQVEELKKDIKTLQDQMASVKTDLKKEVVKLMTELDDEKKHRMVMQVELNRMKKLVLEKD